MKAEYLELDSYFCCFGSKKYITLTYISQSLKIVII
jgi:hypothetical protein